MVRWVNFAARVTQSTPAVGTLGNQPRVLPASRQHDGCRLDACACRASSMVAGILRRVHACVHAQGRRRHAAFAAVAAAAAALTAAVAASDGDGDGDGGDMGDSVGHDTGGGLGSVGGVGRGVAVGGEAEGGGCAGVEADAKAPSPPREALRTIQQLDGAARYPKRTRK
eukprot:330594-Chlamydomonas_euryale.AAC.15